MSGFATREEAERHAAAVEAWMSGAIKPALTPDAIIPDNWDDRWIYLVASDDDMVKVGISRDPDARLASLQSGHHAGLWLLATVAGFHEDEKRLHRMLADHRERGEWFRPGPWLETFMEGARLGENAGMIIKRLEAVIP